MKVLIDIPEGEYIRLKKIYETNCKYTPNAWLPSYITAIGTGTPLPKEYGRLIDADEYRSDILSIREPDLDKILNYLDEQPTIIEADKSESEGK